MAGPGCLSPDKAGGGRVLVFLQLSSCSRGLAQDGIFGVGWRVWAEQDKETRWAGPITEWTPGTSPGCRHDGCCCWSHCRSSGGWSSWLPPAASSACSSGERAESVSSCPPLASSRGMLPSPDSPCDHGPPWRQWTRTRTLGQACRAQMLLPPLPSCANDLGQVT